VLALLPDSAALDGPRLTLAGIDAAALAEEHGTPLVVLCEETIRASAQALRTAVGDGRVFYGTKALPNVAVLRLLREEGVGADVASAGELAFAAAAGLGGRELVVHGNNKDAVFLAQAAETGAPVVLDAPDEAGLAAAAGVGQVLVRVRAASVNALDWHTMRGQPSFIRLVGEGLRRPFHRPWRSTPGRTHGSRSRSTPASGDRTASTLDPGRCYHRQRASARSR